MSIQIAAVPAEAEMTNGYPPRSYTATVLGVLMVITFFSLIDRMIPTFLVGPIRETLAISDTQVSLIQGSAFAIIFSIAGLPLGWLADRSNRRNLIIAGVATWSVATVYCAFAGSFWELFFGRVLVGTGEAALAPAVYSLIADYVEPRRRGRTITTYFLASSTGSGIALVVIGYLIALGPYIVRNVPALGHLQPWQIAFILAGLPGLVLLPTIFVIREVPRRTNSGLIAQPAAPAEHGIPEFLAHLRRNGRAFFAMYFAIACLQFCNVAAYSWAPTFFMRKFGMPPSEVGLILGSTIAGSAFLGTLTSIIASSRLAGGRRTTGLMLIAVTALCVLIPVDLAWPLASNRVVSMALYSVRSFATAAAYAAAPAIVQDIVPNQMRGKAIALYMMVIGLAGYALGPTVVALITDYVFKDDHALPYSLFVCLAPTAALGCLTSIWGLGAYGRLRSTLR
ncbi:MAG: hypothetical protein JWR80_8149 [Bradyrhizobium sp.]|nr:hypothetical protein [Bradyrhizobium sp.]